jgi:hypothetical protein
MQFAIQNRNSVSVPDGIPIVNIGKLVAMVSRAEPPERTPFGARLVAAREHAGLNHPEAARRIGRTQSTIAEAETKGKGCTWLASAARAYGVDPYWLETGKGQMLTGAQPVAVEWPFETIKPDRWAALSERQKGRIEQATLELIEQIEGESGKLPAQLAA